MTGDPPPRASIGEYLAQQRKLRGISVDELCEITKIPRRNIERLESGALDGDTDGFVRGFVRTVAAALGLDPAEAVMRLMQEPDPDPGPEPGWLRTWHLRWLGVALAVLALVALWQVAAAWWTQRSDADAEPQLLRRHDVVGDLVRERAALPPESQVAEAPEPPAAPAPQPSPAAEPPADQ